MRLLLFDIDGTLIKGDKAGRLAMGSAMEQMFGTRGSLDTYQMGGKTDMRIITDLLVEAGFEEHQFRHKLPDFYLLMASFAREIYPTRHIESCPGVDVLLANLRNREHIMVGLLTGNAQATAPLKLAAAGIDPAQFVVGAYGSDRLNRDHLIDLALLRANELTDGVMTGDNAVIIGDTPADVQCARAGRARAVAVATGWHAAEALTEHRPDHLFADLRDTEAVLDVLLA